MNVFVSRLATRLLAVGAVAFLFGFGSPTKAQGAELVIHKLVCYRPASGGGVDQVALSVKADGRNGGEWRQYLRVNDTWNLNSTVLFAATVDITLTAKQSKFGIDKLKKDRYLGGLKLALRYGRDQYFDFRLGGAYYRMHFSVNAR